MVNFLLVQQRELSCSNCLWDSRNKQHHWSQKVWLVREVGTKNGINVSLVDRDRLMLQPLLIKLGKIKQFVKALDKNSEYFIFFKTSFQD